MDGTVNIVDLVLIGGAYATVLDAPPNRNVWGSQFVPPPYYYEYPSVTLSQQQYFLPAILGECAAACPGDTVTLSGTINPNIANYVTPATSLIAGYFITYPNGSQVLNGNLITLHASSGGQAFNTNFVVPAGCFWQLQWVIVGAQQNPFNIVVFADFTLSNAYVTEGWGVLTHST